MMPALYRGVPQVINPPGKFDAEAAFELIARFEVHQRRLRPTDGLKDDAPGGEPPRPLELQPAHGVFSGGEALGTELMGWGRENISA